MLESDEIEYSAATLDAIELLCLHLAWRRPLAPKVFGLSFSNERGIIICFDTHGGIHQAMEVQRFRFVFLSDSGGASHSGSRSLRH